MIYGTFTLLISGCNQHSRNIVTICKFVVIVQLSRECHSLTIPAIGNMLNTIVYVITILCQAHNQILTVHISPLRFISSISITIIAIVGCCIIYRKTSLKGKTFQKHRKIHIYSHVKLILTTCIGIDTSRIKIGNFISLIYLCTA